MKTSIYKLNGNVVTITLVNGVYSATFTDVDIRFMTEVYQFEIDELLLKSFKTKKEIVQKLDNFIMQLV